MKKASSVLMVFCLTVCLSGCAASLKKQEQKAEQDVKKAVNCATAEGDIRALESEKVHAAQQLAAGVSAIVPVGLVAGAATGTEGTKFKMATGEYNEMLDKKIAEIKQECGLQ